MSERCRGHPEEDGRVNTHRRDTAGPVLPRTNGDMGPPTDGTKINTAAGAAATPTCVGQDGNPSRRRRRTGLSNELLLLMNGFGVNYRVKAIASKLVHKSSLQSDERLER
ncbi:hypothetical protein EYF80_035844 [Liparis tanakae]|uniref:Uncharacterized protein n=1 Tax=Liparis tanakae TaxID=230148 RepID=A0A4Z2GKG3_9TELE|nr:hypothetical protein EYF80_035844 [Liparis tanakae]